MFNKHPGGKGDRPILPKDQEKFDNNWDNIFKRKRPACDEATSPKKKEEQPVKQK